MAFDEIRDEVTGELHVPPEVAAAMRELRPELRAKLSLRDIDDMTRPFRKRIRELEEERDIFARTLDKRDGECAEQHRVIDARNTRICELEKLLYDLRDEYGYPYSLDLEDRITATLKDGGKRMRERR